MAIQNRVFIEKQLPSYTTPPATPKGNGLSYWALDDGSKHTGITYIPTKKVLYFAGGDSDDGVSCHNTATNFGLSFTYSAKDGDTPPLYGWTCVGGACRAEGQISPVGLDEPPTAYDPKEDCVWTSSAKGGQANNGSIDGTTCTCADHPLGPKPAGSLYQRGVYRINPNSADQGSWEWELEIPAGVIPPNYFENMPGWDDGLRYDNVPDELVTLRAGYFRHCRKPLSATNFTDYYMPLDPDAQGFSSGPVQNDPASNHWAIDVVGRWAYFLTGSTIRDVITGDYMIVDKRVVNWEIIWTQYVGGINFVASNQFTVNNDRTFDFPSNMTVRTINTGGECLGNVVSSVYQSGPNTTLITLNILPGGGAIDSGLSAVFTTALDALNTARFWRYHLDLHIWQKLPDPPMRPYMPSAGMVGGPFHHRGWSTEIHCHWDSRNKAVLHADHGLWGPGGKIHGVYVWDTTLLTDSGKIRQHSGPNVGGTWTTVPGAHPAWQFFPVQSTGTWPVEANHQYYDPGENVLVCGGTSFGSVGSIHAIWHWRYK